MLSRAWGNGIMIHDDSWLLWVIAAFCNQWRRVGKLSSHCASRLLTLQAEVYGNGVMPFCFEVTDNAFSAD